MVAKRVLAIGCEELEQFASHGRGKTGAHADMLQNVRVIVESEEKGTDLLAGCLLVPAETSDHAVAVAFMLDFEHDPFVWLVGEVERFGDNTVEPRTFKALEPV